VGTSFRPTKLYSHLHDLGSSGSKNRERALEHERNVKKITGAGEQRLRTDRKNAVIKNRCSAGTGVKKDKKHDWRKFYFVSGQTGVRGWQKQRGPNNITVGQCRKRAGLGFLHLKSKGGKGLVSWRVSKRCTFTSFEQKGTNFEYYLKTGGMVTNLALNISDKR